MNKEDARDFIARHYPTYMNRLVQFNTGLTARIKAIDVLEEDNGEFTPTCYLESPTEEDPEFKNHIFSHLPLREVIDTARVVPG